MATASTILHVDMDAFFVSVELLRRPELRGQPVVVGGHGPRGVVAAASYEARAHGVFSAMPSVRAARLCPHAVFLPGDHATYAAVSARVMDLFREYTPLVEPLSLDEAFLDVSGVRRLHGDGRAVGLRIRERVLEQEGLTASVGVAPSKFIAKLASNEAKPTARAGGTLPGAGVVEVRPGDEIGFLHPLPVSALWGVGPVTLDRLHRIGVRTIGDLAGLDRGAVVAVLGTTTGSHLHRLSHGEDDRPVSPDLAPKSVSHEETFAADLTDPDRLTREVVRQADAVASRMRRAGLRGRTVTIKVRFGDFRTITRSTTLATAVDSGPMIARPAKRLLAEVDTTAGVRLLGVGVTGVSIDEPRQLSLDESDPGWDDASRAVDEIRQRYGERAIGPAIAAGPTGVDLVRRGAQQWGPNQPR
ncbi:MAG: DNA polymerase IV [Acidimicrobiales bacterium]|nr:DNA polymerase IV [Acidimicrobiales bacterium]